MQIQRRNTVTQMIFAATLALGLAAGPASAAYRISTNQERQVNVGMTASEVQNTLGKPREVANFRNENGTRWTYEMTGNSHAWPTVFDVTFGNDGRVAMVQEREETRGDAE